MIETNLKGNTPDIAEENIMKLNTIFPEVFTEDKVDFEKLQQVLGDYVEDSNERYNFTWNGKGRALRLSQAPSLGTLRPCKEESKDWDNTKNLYIEGDNLEVLKLLQKSYHGKVKMIYIDPPYNTGKDFVYPDDFHDSLDNYKKLTGQVDSEGNRISTNTEASGRYHTDWLNMMYPRLRLARNLLKDDGVIFISIDDNEVHNLRKICDEVFGEDNFVGLIVWSKKRKGSFLSKGIISTTEYILVYAKSPALQGLFGGKADENESQPIIKRTNKSSILYIPKMAISTKLDDGIYEKGIYGDNINPVELLDDVIVKDGSIINSFSIKAPFIWSQRMFDEQFELGAKFVINTINFQIRVFKISGDDDYKGLNSYVNGVEIKGTNEDAYEELERIFNIKKLFDYSKPINLVDYLAKASTHFNRDAIILDFFSGSSTTAHAVMQLNAEDGGNRKFIMVQLPEPTDEKDEAYKAGYMNICEIGKERIRRAGEKIKEEKGLEAQNLDIGFKVLKLDTSNIRKWQPDYDNLEQSLLDYVDNYVEGRTEHDVVYEIMLKYGLDLTYPVEDFTIAQKKVYSIGFGMLMICLDNEITTEVAKGILEKVKELAPESTRVVFKDNGFKTDSNKTNIKEILKSGGIEEFITL